MTGHQNQQAHGDSSDQDYDDGVAMPEAQWQSPQQQTSNLLSTNAASSDQAAPTSAPMQKRRRVTRACDECRRKKIKCDGKQPCTHCTVYSYDCTYDQPSNRRRNPAPQYVEALENRLQRAEALLRTVLPDVDLDDPSLDVGKPQRTNVMRQEGQPAQPSQLRPWVPLRKDQQTSDGEKDSMLESMVANTGSLDLDDDGNWDFHGHSSGRIFLRRMREQFGDLMGKPDATPFLKPRNISPRSQLMDSPRTSSDTPMDPNLPKTHELPPKHCAQLLCENALDDAGAILRVVHQPTFYDMFHRVYDISYENFGDSEHRFLPLLYGVIALGALFAKADQSQLQTYGYENATDQGYHWFKASRQMVDVTDCRDLTSLQTILYMILFLQSSARLSTCYAYLGIVLRSSIRMGLHRSVSNAFNPVELELRKRIFWIIRKLDIYVGALLGLPQMLSNDDIDQEMPLEIDDEYITTERVSPMPPGKLSVFTAFNAHTRLVEILAKTVKYIYPIKGNEQLRGGNNQSYVVSHTKIREIEQDLQAWMENLPMPFRPGEEASPEFMRIRHLLRMAYAHIQMFLYRPFLHYASQAGQAENVDKRSYACAAACVSVSRNIVHVTDQMKRKGLLVGSYWFYMYTTFFAIMSLVFYILENSRSPRVEDILKDAYEGKSTLAALAAKSRAADRCSKILAELFDQLPSRLHHLRNNSLRKKRQAASPLLGAASRALHSTPVVITKTTLTSKTENSIRKASSSPILPDLQRPSDSQDPGVLRLQVAPTADEADPEGSQDPFGPSNPHETEMQTSTSPNGSMQSNGDQSYAVQNPFYGSGVPDLSDMMFPSADPFAYPNQPMTALENRDPIKQETPMDPGVYNLPGPTTTGGPYENYNAQMYGQIPPYVVQGQPPGYFQGISPRMEMSGGDSNAPSTATQGFGGRQWPLGQQQRPQNTCGMGFDQLYGEDWGGWMSQYRQ